MNRVDKSVPGIQKGRETAKTWPVCFFFWLCLFHGAAVVAGNLVENSSFEAGIDSRFAIDRWYIHGLPDAVLDEDNPVHGRYSLKLPLSRLAYTRAPRSVDGIAFRSTEPVALQAGITYTFSAYVRSDHRLNGKLVLTSAAVGETRESVLVSKPIGVLPRWRRIFLRYTPDKNEHVYWLVRVASEDPGFLWLDALQLEAGPDLTDYRPFASIEASITSARAGKIFSSGKIPEITLRIFNNNARAQPGVSFSLAVYDLAGHRVYARQLIQDLPASAGVLSKIRLPVLKNGIYRCELKAAATGRLAGELHFSVLPEPRHVSPRNGQFGAYTTVSSEPLAIMRRLGFTWVANLTSNGRMIYWDFVEQKPGQFSWYDDDVAMVGDAGARLMFNLEPCKTPSWAQKLSRRERLEKWKNYVTRMVEHYGSIVKYWTIADESHSFNTSKRQKNCWANGAEYVPWHVAGAEAIRSVDPDARIILNTSPEFAREVLPLLPEKSVDILAGNFFHVKGEMARIADVAGEYGIQETWAPGVGPSSYSFYRSHIRPGRRQSTSSSYWDDMNMALVKQVVGALGTGTSRLFHYTATYVGNTNGFSVFEADSSLKPMGAQYGALAWLLDGTQQARRVEQKGYDRNLFVYRFDRADGTSVFPVWGLPAKRQTFSFPWTGNAAKPGILDAFGNVMESREAGSEVQFEAGRQPVFILVPARDADRLEQALKKLRYNMQEFPESWDVTLRGDYAVVMGARDEYHRPAPNVSFWYRSAARGWIEVLQSRSSTYLPAYGVDSQGLKLSWKIVPGPGPYHLEPGLIPKKFLDGASVRHLSGKPGDLHTARAYRVDLDRYAKTPLKENSSVAGLQSPHAIIVESVSGVTLIIETWYEGSEKVTSGVWDLVTRKDLDQAFLHRWIANKPQSTPVQISVQVSIREQP